MKYPLGVGDKFYHCNKELTCVGFGHFDGVDYFEDMLEFNYLDDSGEICSISIHKDVVAELIPKNLKVVNA